MKLPDLRIEIEYSPDHKGCSGRDHFKANWDDKGVLPQIPIKYVEVSGSEYHKAKLYFEGKLLRTLPALALDELSNFIADLLAIK